MWAERTGWDRKDWTDHLKLCLNKEYLTRISYMQPAATTYDQYKGYGYVVEKSLIELNNDLRQIKGKAPGVTSVSIPNNSGFRDPNAMDIDATNTGIADQLIAWVKGLTSQKDIYTKWQQFMKGRCTCCGSSGHVNSTTKHPNVICNHCQKPNHYARVCLKRLYDQAGVAPRQKIAATSGTSSTAPAPTASSSTAPAASSATVAASNQDIGATVAALADSMSLMQKTLADIAQTNF